MYNQNLIRSPSFSLCFGTEGGFLTLGGNRKDKHLKGEKKQTIPYNHRTDYQVKVSRVKVGTRLTEINGKEIYRPGSHLKFAKMLFDSGTTFSYFPKKMFNSIIKSISEYCKKDKKNCGGLGDFSKDSCASFLSSSYASKDAFLDSFPPIEFVFEKNKKYVWFPRDYLAERPNPFDDKSPNFCCTIQLSDSPEIMLLGAMFMRHYDIYFNRRKEEISFVRAHCDGDRVQSIMSYIDGSHYKTKRSKRSHRRSSPKASKHHRRKHERYGTRGQARRHRRRSH